MIGLTRTEIKTPTSGILKVWHGGQGPAVVALHRSTGGDNMDELLSDLVRSFSVVAPSLPGYDGSDTPEWARSPRDLAAVLSGALKSFVPERPVLVGFGLGGWLAAEMASMCPERLRALVLGAPLGVQPQVGEIFDPFLVSTERYVELGFADQENYRRTFEQIEIGSEEWLRRERNREMTTRIAWQPRMFDPTLPFRLPLVTTPTTVIWGEQDRILPRSAVERYVDAIPGARLVTVADSGHILENEVPGQVFDVIASLASDSTT
jgi:pimeloyl-ACP methyl ester carboxylesterase